MDERGHRASPTVVACPTRERACAHREGLSAGVGSTLREEADRARRARGAEAYRAGEGGARGESSGDCVTAAAGDSTNRRVAQRTSGCRLYVYKDKEATLSWIPRAQASSNATVRCSPRAGSVCMQEFVGRAPAAWCRRRAHTRTLKRQTRAAVLREGRQPGKRTSSHAGEDSAPEHLQN